jgi:hypothetical protein
MTPAIEDFAAIKARLDELRREKVQQQPLPDTNTGGPAAPNSEPVYDCASGLPAQRPLTRLRRDPDLSAVIVRLTQEPN